MVKYTKGVCFVSRSVRCMEFATLPIPSWEVLEWIKRYADGQATLSEVELALEFPDIVLTEVLCRWSGDLELMIFPDSPDGVWYCPRCNTRHTEDMP
jgi:hypothetical protein